MLDASRQESNCGLGLSLLSGESSLSAFRDIQLADISDDVRLNNCFNNSGSRDLFEFLQLGKRRYLLRNYGKVSEAKLLIAVLSVISKLNDASEPLDAIPTHSISKQHKSNISELPNLLLKSNKPWSLITETDWYELRKTIRDSELRHQPIYPIVCQLKGYWPFGKSGNQSRETIGKYLDLSLKDLRNEKRFGRRKIASYMAAIAFLCHQSKAPPSPSNDSSESLISEVLFAWENSKLNSNEKYVIEKRFGIRSRKHTLNELGSILGLTRERIRQIQNKAIQKLKLNERIARATELINSLKLEVWNKLAGGESYLRKSIDLDQLEDHLPFEMHLAIELCVSRLNRSIKRAALYDWLTTNFPNDESNWYVGEEISEVKPKANSTHINGSLQEFLSSL